MNKISIFILVVLVAFIIFYNRTNGFLMLETFTTSNLEKMTGKYPEAQETILVQDSYPSTGKKGVSDETANKMWWRYPIFEVGSYQQITNNIKYPDNPDIARCTPSEFCFALYNNKMVSNVIEPLPQINPECGTRVGYFSTSVNLLPYRNDMQNILY